MVPEDLVNRTLDIFAEKPPEQPLSPLGYPSPERFPLNIEGLKVQTTVVSDLRESLNPLIVTGFAGLDRLLDFCTDQHALNPDSKIRILIGHEPFESRRESFSVTGNSLPSDAESYWLKRGISLLHSAKVIQMVDLLKSGRVTARYFPGGRRLHAKIYCGDNAATVGSSNFTDPGMAGQIEANARFTSNKDSKRFRELTCIANNYWERGESYQSQLIALLEKLLRVVSWQEALARAAAELLEGEWAEQYLRGDYLSDADTLWPSQKQGIAQALTILSTQGSVLVADATGAGKTRMGTYLIGAIHDQIIRSGRMWRGEAIMVCPPAVEKNWEEESQWGSVPLKTFSHGKLSHKKSKKHELTIDALKRAQILCVDEGHNFLNIQSSRSQHLLRNIADHVVMLTATPINKSVTDLLRMADMLGADNLSPSILSAFDKMLGARKINRQLTEPELDQLQKEIRRFTVRRTKKQLNQLVDRNPNAYRDKDGSPCRFPTHKPKVYGLGESQRDRGFAAKIAELADQLHGVTHFTKPIEMPEVLASQGLTEDRYLSGRLQSAKKLAKYIIMSSLRSSRAALIEHIEGTEAAIQYFEITNFAKGNSTGNVVNRLKEIGGTLPENRLSIDLPEWLSDPTKHKEVCTQDANTYRSIAESVREMSDGRERSKVDKLIELLETHQLVLAFDSRPITLALLSNTIAESDRAKTIMAFGGSTTGRERILNTFAHGSTKKGIVGLCSDSLAEGVNLQQASALVHLDMPSVVRIAEQRSGRVDRMDSPHESIEIWWPEDSEEFALRSDDRFIERYEAVEKILGSNMPLPRSMTQTQDSVVQVKDMIREAESASQSWDGIDDAFKPVRSLIEGKDAIVPPDIYKHYRYVTERVLSRVSLVKAEKPWALFCIVSGAFGAPRWILLGENQVEPTTELADIAPNLRERLNDSTENLSLESRAAKLIDQFVSTLSNQERNLLARKKQRALEEMSIIIEKVLPRAKTQTSIDHLRKILEIFERPSAERQPDWDEVALRWIDLIRPIWFEKLNSRRKKPLLLKDIRRRLLDDPEWLIPRIEEHFQQFPFMPSIEERIKACIIGID